MEKEEIKTLIKETVTEVANEFRSNSAVFPINRWNFHVNQIDNGFILETYGPTGEKRIFAETKEKAFELAQEFCR